jgi:alanine dehydrogenase
MIIGVPREIHRHEHRVGLTPMAVARLAERGHSVIVEHDAGMSAHFANEDFEKAGAQIVHSRDEVYKRPDLICRIGMIAPEELEHLKPGMVICGFHHLAVTAPNHIERLMELKATLIGYEIIHDWDGNLPVLIPLSEMAGQMILDVAAQYLQTQAGGRGVLLGNVPGVPPATILVLGAGHVGYIVARQALARGAHVIVFDVDLKKLRAINHDLGGQVVTITVGQEKLEQYLAIADVVIGAVLIPGGRSPYVINEEMVKKMKRGSVIIDASIDQGGCVETSRPTTIDNPTFVTHGVVHYCVPNMTTNIARTASRALANSALPCIMELVEKGVETALWDDPGLAAGVYLYRGKMVNMRVGESLGIAVTPLRELIEEGRKV